MPTRSSVRAFYYQILRPTQLSGCVLWLDFTDRDVLFTDTAGTTKAAALADAVARINDKSTSGNNFTQSTAAKCPTYNANGGVLFDGSNDVLQGGNTGLNITTRTIIVSFTPAALPASTQVLFNGGGGTNYYAGLTSGKLPLVSWQNATSTNKGQNPTSPPTFGVGIRTFYAARWLTDSSNVTVDQWSMKQSLKYSTYTDGHATPAGTNYFVGGLGATPSNPVNVNIHHVIAYNRYLSNAELVLLEKIL